MLNALDSITTPIILVNILAILGIVGVSLGTRGGAAGKPLNDTRFKHSISPGYISTGTTSRQQQTKTRTETHPPVRVQQPPADPARVQQQQQQPPTDPARVQQQQPADPARMQQQQPADPARMQQQQQQQQPADPSAPHTFVADASMQTVPQELQAPAQQRLAAQQPLASHEKQTPMQTPVVGKQSA
jgi:FtsZ-interacting cell division protein ZipA